MPVDGVDRHFELRHGQLAAGDDRRPADADPALVDLPLVEQAVAGRQRHLLVVHRIEEADDLAVDADRAGNPDVAAEGGGDPLGDARLAVARRAEQEQPPAGVDRRPQPVEHARRSAAGPSNARCRLSAVGCCLVSDWAWTLAM